MHWILKIALWALSGYLASRFMKFGKPEGIIGNIILGFVGGLLGSLVFALIGLSATNIIGDILVSLAGSCLAIFLFRKFDLGRFFR